MTFTKDVFKCSNPGCDFISLWRSKVDRHCISRRECQVLGAEAMVVKATIHATYTPPDDGRRISTVVLVDRVPTGISDRSSVEYLEQRAEYLVQATHILVPKIFKTRGANVVDVYQDMLGHCWGMFAPIKFRTFYFYRGRVHNFCAIEDDEPVILQYHHTEEHTMQEFVSSLVCAITDIMDMIAAHQKTSERVRSMIAGFKKETHPPGCLCINDRIEKTADYEQHRRKPQNQRVITLAIAMSKRLGDCVRDMPFKKIMG